MHHEPGHTPVLSVFRIELTPVGSAAQLLVLFVSNPLSKLSWHGRILRKVHSQSPLLSFHSKPKTRNVYIYVQIYTVIYAEEETRVWGERR
jgi:hypothetical protein